MRDILRIAIPISVWIAAFSAVYGLEGVICSRHWTGLSLVQGRTSLIAAWLVAIAVQVLLLALRSSRFASPSPFMRGVSIGLAVVALVATVWTLFPVATMEICA